LPTRLAATSTTRRRRRRRKKNCVVPVSETSPGHHPRSLELLLFVLQCSLDSLGFPSFCESLENPLADKNVPAAAASSFSLSQQQLIVSRDPTPRLAEEEEGDKKKLVEY